MMYFPTKIVTIVFRLNAESLMCSSHVSEDILEGEQVSAYA
jgi:hypothetical protein